MTIDELYTKQDFESGPLSNSTEFSSYTEISTTFIQSLSTASACPELSYSHVIRREESGSAERETRTRSRVSELSVNTQCRAMLYSVMEIVA